MRRLLLVSLVVFAGLSRAQKVRTAGEGGGG